MHKKKDSSTIFLKQIGSCNKRLYAQGGGELLLLFLHNCSDFSGILHFIIISIVIMPEPVKFYQQTYSL